MKGTQIFIHLMKSTVNLDTQAERSGYLCRLGKIDTTRWTRRHQYKWYPFFL